MTMHSPFLSVRILSPSAQIFEGEAQSCLMPTPEGLTKILPRHMPVVGRLLPGIVSLSHDNGEQTSYDVENGGFYRVSPDSANIWIY